MNNTHPIEDRVWAVIVHLSALAMGLGVLLPVIGWSENRGKSNYTSFQSLQALGYQSLGYTIWILTTLVVIFFVGVGSVASVANIRYVDQLETEVMRLVFAHITLILGLVCIYFVLPIIAAIACATGKEFRYPIMGERLARYLGYDFLRRGEGQLSLNEEHEDRWVASMGHFSIIIVLWGMLVPLLVWFTQGKRSSFLKLQSVQAFAFQTGTLLLYIFSMIIYFGGSIFFFLSIGGMDAANLDSSIGIISLVVFLGSSLCAFGILLLVPILHIMGQWAGYRNLKGDEYRYPIIGIWVERWLLKNTKSPTEETSE